MAVSDLDDWLNCRLEEGSIWYLKRLSANDTLATEAHQAGPYVPRDLLFEVFPALHDRDHLNPDVTFNAHIDSDSDHRKIRAIWYNNKLFGKTRNETRLTNWGGAASSILNPDSTGALTAFVFTPQRNGKRDLHVWVCRNPSEEDLVGDRVGPVEPGAHVVWRPGATGRRGVIEASGGALSCRLTPARMPPGWLTVFPTGAEIVRKVCELRPASGETPDDRLIRRRECEFAVFQSVEEAIETPQLKRGFSGIAEFLTSAQRVLQRRKARSGRSLELQTREIFIEEGMIEDKDFSHGAESDPGKKPDFLFPSERAYKNMGFPAARLRLLAAKTTCKDRWRQVINEASRIRVKHLLTLQEGVSATQFAEMKASGIRLVVPESLISKFPRGVQTELITLSDFINSVRTLRGGRSRQ